MSLDALGYRVYRLKREAVRHWLGILMVLIITPIKAWLVLNWFMPNAPGGFLPAYDKDVLKDAKLKARDLTWSGGEWMPALEPVVDYVPNYAVLGYQRDEVIRQMQKGGGKPRS